ncbi:FAD-dependent oxidoreductase [Solirubrobacter taibaiensis]|nr:FAD-dependent oxidoreductase [Solirubrobacter taibaiensis]
MSDAAAQFSVAVVGAGLAGLSAAIHLQRAGVEVVVLEAADRVGGRTLTRSLDGQLIECGAEWLGPRHVRLRRLARSLGLRIEPVRQLGRPVLWRESAGDRVSRAFPPGMRVDMVRALGRAGRLARTIDPSAPWTGPGAAHDLRTVGDLFDAVDVSERTRHYVGAMMEMLSGTPTDQLSLLHLLWWIRRAGGPVRAFRGSFDAHIVEGTQAVANAIAERLDRAVVVESPVTHIAQDGVVALTAADDRTYTARRAIIAAPWHGSLQPTYDPPLPAALARLDELRSGPGIKVFGTLPDGHRPSHRIALGGPLVKGAWLLGQRVTGYVPPTVEAPDDAALVTELASAFGLRPEQLRGSAVFRWSGQPAAGGCDIGFRPGQLTRHGATLSASHGLVEFAGVERSSWPNNMEGAVESGQAAAARVLSALQR